MQITRGVRKVIDRRCRSNALVQLQAHDHHCGEAASEKCLSAATFVRRRSVGQVVGVTPDVVRLRVFRKLNRIDRVATLANRFRDAVHAIHHQPICS